MLKIKSYPKRNKLKVKAAGNPVSIGSELAAANISILDRMSKEVRKTIACALADTIKNHFEDEKEGK